MKPIHIKSWCSLLLLASTFACNVLDREPLDQVSPEAYYKTAPQLESFSINLYSALPNTAGNWGAGMAAWDNGTDNQAGTSPNRSMFTRDNWKVPSSGGLGVESIRNINWFLVNVGSKIESGEVTGNREQINQSLGEVYFFRAFHYFTKLKNFGDYPIVTRDFPDDETLLKENAKRAPRNEVARFILSDLDKAIELLMNAPQRKQRISKDVARLFKSRVALYEGTFEKYHRGSGRVPGDAQWPGKDKEWNSGKTFDQEAEVHFFLETAMKEAKLVADAHPTLTPNSHVFNPTTHTQVAGWNPYYDMFATPDPSSLDEVLLWRQFNIEAGLVHHTSRRLYMGSATGWTRGLVESFLMSNGLPIYAPTSGYTGDDATIKKVKENRDERLQLFLFAEGDALALGEDAIKPFEQALLLDNPEVRETTAYRQRKGMNYLEKMRGDAQSDESALIIFRTPEAYLNYIEASYLLNGSLDADATRYWTALRARAGITAPIATTIQATDMSIEANVNRPSYDWAAFSAGQPIDATLYSIRRERRSEFCGEGYRMDDLKRWRAMDQVKDYQIEGANFWTTIKDYDYFKNKDGASKLVYDNDSKANISSPTLGKYLRPYQIIKGNNDMYNGYTFFQAHYLTPFSTTELQLCSPTGNAIDSYLYQNPGWSYSADTEAEY